MSATVADVLDALRTVWDPELAIDVVALGLVYDVRLADGRVEIDMTLTTPGCPVSESLPAEAADAVRTVLPDVEVDVRVVWDPPWTPDRMATAGTAVGISPRGPRARRAGSRRGGGRAG